MDNKLKKIIFQCKVQMFVGIYFVPGPQEMLFSLNPFHVQDAGQDKPGVIVTIVRNCVTGRQYWGSR